MPTSLDKPTIDQFDEKDQQPLPTTTPPNEETLILASEDKLSPLVILLVACSSISGLLFGYDTGVISGALVTIRDDLTPNSSKGLSDGQKEFITSATTLGALIGGLFGGAVSDWTGRKFVLALADVIFIGGAVAQAVCRDVWSMIGGRFLIGIGVGLASCIAPLYIQELSPTKLRGRMVVVNVVMITLGQVIAYGIDAGFANVHAGWRWMVGLGCVPAALQLGCLVFLPESPRVLLKKNKTKEARGIIRKIYAYASEDEIDLKMLAMEESVKRAIAIEKGTTFWGRLRELLFVGANRRALIVACGLQAYQQLCGFNTLMYYSSTLFSQIGFNQPTAVGLIISGTNFLFTLVALKWIDRVGRRRIMVWSAPGMVVGLVLASVGFHFLTKKTNGILIEGTKYPHSWAALVLVSMIIFVASYATGLGNVPWQQGEFFSFEVRGLGTSLSTTTNWSSNLLINSTYLSLMARITPSGAFGFYAGICLVGWVWVVGWMPETKGVGLEDVGRVFESGFGVW